MARVAVVDVSTKTVLSIIIADAGEMPYPGTFLVDVDNIPCDVGWVYDPVVNDFVNPNPLPPEEVISSEDVPPPDDEGG